VIDVMLEHRAMAAGLGFTWTKVPAITVVGAADDRRQALIRDAVAFWNDTLAALGSGFRLGAITQRPESVPDAVIAGMSQTVLSGTPEFPPELASIPGDIVVALPNVDFISFSTHWANGKGLVAIKKRGRLSADPSECRAQRNRARVWACDRPYAQRRSNQADVRSPGAVPAYGV
jgi:hypothetical protein